VNIDEPALTSDKFQYCIIQSGGELVLLSTWQDILA